MNEKDHLVCSWSIRKYSKIKDNSLKAKNKRSSKNRLKNKTNGLLKEIKEFNKICNEISKDGIDSKWSSVDMIYVVGGRKDCICVGVCFCFK